MAIEPNDKIEWDWDAYNPLCFENTSIEKASCYFKTWQKLWILKKKLDVDLQPSFFRRFFFCCERYRYRWLSQDKFGFYHKSIWEALADGVFTRAYREKCTKIILHTCGELRSFLKFLLEEGIQYPGLRKKVGELEPGVKFQLWATLRGLNTVKVQKKQRQYLCHSKCFKISNKDINLLKAHMINTIQLELKFYVPSTIDFDTLCAWIQHIAPQCPTFVEALRFENTLKDSEWTYLYKRLNKEDDIFFFRDKNTIFIGSEKRRRTPAEETFYVRQTIDAIMLKRRYPTTEFDCSLFKQLEDFGKLEDRLALHDPYLRLGPRAFSDLTKESEEEIKAYYGLQMWAFWVFNKKIRKFFRNIAIYSVCLIWFWEWTDKDTWKQKMSHPVAIIYCLALVLNSLYFAFIDVPRIADNLQMWKLKPKSLIEMNDTALATADRALSNIGRFRNLVDEFWESFHVGRFICWLISFFFLIAELLLLKISINLQGFTTNLNFTVKPEYIRWWLYQPKIVQFGKSLDEAWIKDLPGTWAALIHVTVFFLLNEIHAIMADILVRKLGDFNSRKEEEASVMNKRFLVEVVETHVLTLFILWLASHEGFSGIVLLQVELSSIFMIDQVRKLTLETAKPLFEQWCCIWLSNLNRFCKRKKQHEKFPNSREAFWMGIDKEFTLQETEWFDQFFEPLNMVGYLQFAWTYPIAGPVSWVMQIIEDCHDSFRIRHLERRVWGTTSCHMEVWESWVQKIVWIGLVCMVFIINIAKVDNWYVPSISVLVLGITFNQIRSTDLWKDFARYVTAKVNSADEQAEKLWDKALDAFERISTKLCRQCCMRKSRQKVANIENVPITSSSFHLERRFSLGFRI